MLVMSLPVMEAVVAQPKFGKDGKDQIIEVPCGTVAYDAETGEFLCDVKEDGQEVL